MNGRDEELLSAYYDGELPDDEEARAEQLLTDDVTARESLDDVAEVSGWIRELPQIAAPAGLHDEVLARIRAGAAPQPLQSVRARSGWRRWVGWSAVSAAGLLVAALVYRQQSEWPAATVADRSFAARESALKDEMPFVVASRFDATTAERSSRLPAAPVEPQPIDFVQVAMANSVQFQEQLAEQLRNGQAPIAGEEYTNLTQVGDRVVVIKYRIVDVEKLPGEVQLVLTNHGITEVADSQSGLTTFEYGSGTRKLDAFYVEAPETNFTSAMTDITNLNGVMAVSENSFVSTEDSPLSGRRADAALSESVGPSDGPTNDGAASPPVLTAAAAPQSLSDRDAGISNESKPVAQAGTTASLGVATEGRSATDEAAPPTDGYQVAVSARPELILELQEQKELFFDTDRDSRESLLAASPQQLQHAKRMLNRNWEVQKDRVQGPPAAPNRVRAVILLVPDQPE